MTKPLIIAPKLRTMVDYRNLVRICEQQAALCADPRAREELKAMAGEYRVSAEWQERQQTADARRTKAVRRGHHRGEEEVTS